jgi:hypothetical protein
MARDLVIDLHGGGDRSRLDNAALAGAATYSWQLLEGWWPGHGNPAPAWAGTAVFSCRTQHIKHVFFLQCADVTTSGAGKSTEKLDNVRHRIDNQQA